MTAEDMIRIAEDSLSAFNEGDWERFKANLSPDSVYVEFATRRRVEGADKIAEVNRGWKQAFPDARGTLNNTLAAGNTVVQEITWDGTNSGPMETPNGAMPATGRPVTIRAALLSIFEGDKIREARHYFDMQGMLEQLGLVAQERVA